jgi:methionyl aminopeptidase
MINLGVAQTKTLKDGWTVVTIDGQPSAHAEHTIAITEQGPEVLTLVSAGARQFELASVP